jgi:hypothetical protein
LVTTPEEFDSMAADLRAVRSVSRMEARLMAVITEGTVTIIVKHPIGLATQKG